MAAYLNFDLLIERSGDEYVARVISSPAGEAEATFAPPFNDAELEALSARMDRSRGRMRRMTSPDLSAAKEMGDRLYRSILGPEIRARLRESVAEAQSQGAIGVRIRLHLDKAPELATLPWEFLHDPDHVSDRFVALAKETPLVRYLRLPERPRPLSVTPPLKILLVVANPSDQRFDELDVEGEVRRLDEALRPQIDAGRISLTRLPVATVKALQDELGENEYHILHFIGHGRFDHENQDGLLAFEGERGGAYEVSAESLGALLHNEPTLRLAVLNACEGGRGAIADAYAGMAQTLLRSGVPAVVAMQYPISDRAAIVFSRQFYRNVAQGQPVDAAVTDARLAVNLQVNQVEWATPILYMRASDGRIFDISAAAVAFPSPPVAPAPILDAAASTLQPAAPEEKVTESDPQYDPVHEALSDERVEVPPELQPEPMRQAAAEPVVPVESALAKAVAAARRRAEQRTEIARLDSPAPLAEPSRVAAAGLPHALPKSAGPALRLFRSIPPAIRILVAVTTVMVAITWVESSSPRSSVATQSPAVAPPTAASSNAAAATIKGTIVIASDFPVSGAVSQPGKGVQAGVAFAIQGSPTIKGFTIVHKPYDHAVNNAVDPQRAAQNAADMCNNADVLAMVGPFGSNIARTEIPVANRCGLVMISPTNTSECLTLDLSYCDPKPAALRPSGKNTYFRTVGPDTVQGPAMADFAIDALKLRKIAVWSDGGTYGKTAADAFEKRFQQRAGSVVLRGDFDTKTTTDLRPWLQRAKDAGAEAIYAGTDATCVVRSQMTMFATTVPYLGTMAMQTPQCLKDSGGYAANMYVPVAGLEASQDPANRAIIDAFNKAFPSTQNPFTFAGYDSAMILLDAIARAIDKAGGNKPTRAQVLQAVEETKDLKLTTSTFAFDKNGDPTPVPLSIYQSKGIPTDWVFIQRLSVYQLLFQ